MESLKLLNSCCLTLAFCICFLLNHHHAAAAANNDPVVSDIRSLIAFKKCITSDPHSVLQDWEPHSTNACNFTGIQCSHKRVISVHLDSNALQGSITSAIGDLSMLRVLNLFNNSLSGFIPPHLGKLSQLQELHLGYNMLKGAIPPQLGNLSSLQHITLEVNSLVGIIPHSFGQLSQLKILYIFNNTLTGPIPPELGNLTCLESLDVANNSLNGSIPASLGKLTRLKLLYLYSNSLVGPIPASLGELKQMTDLKLSDNHLSGPVPASLGQVTRLRFLESSHNLLHGCIPHQLGNLSSLQLLDLQKNSLQGTLPNSLTNATSLMEVYLCFNELNGTLPESIGRLNKLQVLVLGINSFRGSIPKSMANITSLEILSLKWNRMEGTLPACISTFSKFKILTLTENHFSGALPDSWRNTSSLFHLQLGDNNLQGTLPKWLGNLSHLEQLFLDGNSFTSKGTRSDQSIPILKSLFNCRRLRKLGMRSNYLQGVLPSNIGSHWPNIEKLYLGSNIIYGRIPGSIGNYSSLFRLDLSRNLLDGTIPSEMGNMSDIQYIDFSHNKLQGNIPSELALARRTLAYLYLQDNNLSGPISPSIGELANLRNLSLSMNSFSGEIPPELGTCLVLEDLDLSANNLSGEIPQQVAALKSIQFGFNLSGNSFTGTVPEEIGGMQMAQYIDLSNNRLSGNIGIHIVEWLNAVKLNLTFNNFTGNLSEKIGYKLTQLQSIDISCNSFTGQVPKSLANLSYLHFLNFSNNNFQGQVPCEQGIFKKLSKWSFIGNPLLCGGCLGLIECKMSRHHASHTFRLLKGLLISITSLCGVVVFSLSFWFLLRKWNSSKSRSFSTRKFENLFMKLSMEELQRATQCFSAENLIGQGRYGQVYSGTLNRGQKVAIKVFSLSNENRSENSFRKECQILGKLRHRNLIKILTVVYSGDFRAIVMAYMSNGSLHSLVHAQDGGHLRSLCLEVRLRILRELAGALSYLHHDCSPPVIHCDVKPHNVLLDEDMTVKLSDFGIAHYSRAPSQPQQAAASASSSSFAVKGSIGYVPPEYGIGGEVSIKGDVYSFGVVMLEVITRVEPTHEMFGPHLTLPDWMSTVFQTNIKEERMERLEQILTRVDDSGGGIEIQKEKDLEAVEGMLRVALVCTSKYAVKRPSMKEVGSVLSMIYDSYTSSSSTIELENQWRLPFDNLDGAVRKVETQPPLMIYGNAGMEMQEVSSSTL